MKFVIHPLMIVFFVILSLLGYFNLFLVYLLTVVLHEFAHAFVASRLGYKLNNIKLMPYGASLSGQNSFFSSKDEISIAIAGPAFNLILATLICAVWWLEPITYVYTKDFMMSNLTIAFINFLPVFPLDGGRILLSVLAMKESRLSAFKKVRCLGIFCSSIILIGFVITSFFIPNYTFLVFGSFIFISSILEDNATSYAMVDFLSFKQKELERGLVIRNIAVFVDCPLYRLITKVKKDRLTIFSVVDSNYNVVGKIFENQLESLIKIYPAKTTLSQIIYK